MIEVSGLSLLAAAASALVVGSVLYVVAPPPRSLGSRIRPYLKPTMSQVSGRRGGGALTTVFGPLFRDTAESLAAMIERAGGEITLVRVRQAGWFDNLSDEETLPAYRMAQLKNVVLGGLGAFVSGWLIGLPLASRLALTALGLFIGGSRLRGRLDKAIETRRELMRIEIYTVNQLLAMRVRAGGGVIHAVSATVARGQGAVIDELAQALRLHRAGWRGSDAFRRISELTPEPFCARTYRLLAAAEERGSDLATSLLALSEDVRETRREAIKRSATKRRAAMLVPTIAILAPILIVFVAAPLPYLITGWQ